MTYANVQYQNRGNDEGDVLNFFNDKLRNLIQRNSGDNTFSIVQENCHDKDEPVNLNTKTKLRLTHSAHTMSQIEKGFVEIFLQLKLKLDAEKPLFYDKAHRHLQYIFVGFKDAVELISEAFFWVDGRLVDNYHQNEMIRESFAYNCIRGKDAKKACPHSHSLWEDVCMMSPNVCGCYIPIEKFFAAGAANDEVPRETGKDTIDASKTDKLPAFKADKEVDVEIKLCIPFTDQLVLQAWRLYPNRILGEMEEEVKFAVNGLVWCQVNPKHVAEVKKFWQMAVKTEYGTPDYLPITNHFVQINNPAIIVQETKYIISDTDKEFGIPNAVDNTALKYYGTSTTPSVTMKGGHIIGPKTIEYSVCPATLKVMENGCKITHCKTNCAGFGIKPDVIQALMETLNEPIIIPAQELTRHQFEGHPNASGFKQSKTVPLRNATNITVMFPLHNNDYTVFQNINYKDVKLIVNKKTYPETEWEHTWDARFVQYQLMANELDGMIEPTQEFMESISKPLSIEFDRKELSTDRYRCASDPDEGKRLLMCPFDNTSFGINFQLERGNAGYVFDGIDTGSHTVSVDFHGSPMRHDESDVLFYPDLGSDLQWKKVTDTSSPPPPELWICSDTYWTWSVQDGVRYYQRGIPAGYE